MDDDTATGDGGSEGDDAETVRAWLVERTYSDDEQNVVILVYATPDGERYLRKERALTSFGDDRPTRAAVEVAPARLAPVADPETQERYAASASQTAEEYGPDDEV